MKRPNIYECRWIGVLHLFNKKIMPLFDLDGVEVLFDGIRINKENVFIDLINKTIDVKIGNCSYCVYNGDITHDEGAHDTIGVTCAKIREDFVAYRRVQY